MTNLRANAYAGRWIFWTFLAFAAFYLLAEHRAHLAGSLRWLPIGLLLLCPLLHVFMHKGHQQHEPHRDLDENSARPVSATPSRASGGATSVEDRGSLHEEH